jgi:hypothetical protein
MQKLQLYISGQRIDLFKDEQVSFNQSIQNIKDPGKVFANFTQTFTVPASKTNNKIFKHYYNYNITNGFDARNKVASTIELNNISYKTGLIALNGVELKNNSPYAYKITFYGNTVNLKEVLGDLELGQLSGTLDSIDSTLSYDSPSIKTKLQNGTDIITPLITHTQRLIYDSGSHGSTVDINNVYYEQGTGHYHGVLWSELKYAVRLHKIIEGIQNEFTIANGYQADIVFSDDFFNTSNLPYYNLFMWLHRKKGNVEPTIQGTNPYTTQVTGFIADSGNAGNTTMTSGNTLNISPLYSNLLDSELVLRTSSGESYYIVIYQNGLEWFTSATLTGSQTFNKTDFPNSQPLPVGSYTVSIFSTSTNSIIFSDASDDGIEWTISGKNPVWQDNWKISTFTHTADFAFIVSQQIPKMKILDFLTSLFKMFNLTAYYDDYVLLANNSPNPNYGKIVVQTLDSFYSTNFNTWDISEYIDTKTNAVDVALPYYQVNFAYEGLGTFIALQFEQLFNQGWGTEFYSGEYRFTTPNEEYNITIPFEHMQYERLIDANDGTTKTTAQYGYCVDDNFDSYIGKPIVFYPYRITASETGHTPISFRDDGSNHSQINNYYIPSNSLDIDPSVSTSNINFKQENNEWTGTNTEWWGTLFNNYYISYISDVFNQKRRIFKYSAYLPLKIIYKLQMNDLIVVNNQEYLINSININLIDGKSNIELINNFNSTSSQLTNVGTSALGPFDTTLYFNRSIINANELSVGDVIYTDDTLTTTASADTYYQLASNESTSHCNILGSILVMVLNSNGVITSISCALP